MRRRGPGVGGIKKHDNLKSALKEKAAELQEDKVQHATEIIGTFKTQLEDFARKYKSQIKSDPYFRMQFQTMCEKIGVDPLASSKGIWEELLGLGDFYYELGVRIVEICIVTRPSNGGLISLSELVTRLNKGGSSIAEDDVKRSVSRIKKLGGGFGLVTLSNGGKKVQMIASVPLELNHDQTDVLGVASINGGHISASKLSAKTNEKDTISLGWERTRAERALNRLTGEGLAWVDTQAGNDTEYWFPSIWFGLQSDDGLGAATSD